MIDVNFRVLMCWIGVIFRFLACASSILVLLLFVFSCEYQRYRCVPVELVLGIAARPIDHIRETLSMYRATIRVSPDCERVK